MPWDDFLAQAQDFAQSDTVQTIHDYIQDNPGSLQLVKNTLAQSGNQTAAQLAAGIPGAPPPIAAPASAGTAAAAQAKNAGSGLFAGQKIAGMSLGVILLIGVGAYFLLGHKGRK